MENVNREKPELKFDKSGNLKILMMSDIQESLEYDRRTTEGMERIVDAVRPDFVMLGGDNCDGRDINNHEELEEYLKIFTAPMEKRGIPWAHIFGNHDHDMAMDDAEEQAVYEKFSCCISGHTQGIYGTTNFLIPVKSSDGTRTAFALWGLDTNNHISESDMVKDVEIKIKRQPTMSGVWDIIHFEQLMWYWKNSVELERRSGRVNGIMFMHMPLWEFQYIPDNPDLTDCRGSTAEIMNTGMFNSGMFAAILQRKDIRCIAAGHSHNDCFDGEYCNIKMCLDACAGYSPYGTDELRGGRVFEINERDTRNINTYMVHYADL